MKNRTARCQSGREPSGTRTRRRGHVRFHPKHFTWICLLVAACTNLGAAGNESPALHWAFRPPVAADPPAPRRIGWVQSPIDAFVLAKLEGARLRPAPPADKATLLRRVTFDLIGLPPTPEDLDAFLADRSPDAFARVVDRLLASPHYGERWGRHWLDLARYADSNGQDENKAMAHAWRYRDYVIDAFNRDKPFDQFVREQLAGDLLPAPPDERESHLFDRWIATGFLVLGPKMLAEQDKPKLVMDIVDEQIDVVCRAFLGLTVACSRCHDHKTDPIAARDYYALAGIFKSTKTMANLAFVSQWNERVVATTDERARHDAHLRRTNEVAQALAKIRRDADAEVHARWHTQAVSYFQAALAADDASKAFPELLFGSDGLLAPPEDPQPFHRADYAASIARLEAERASLASNAPPAPARALAVEEGAPVDLPVHHRGSHLNPGPVPVPRGFLPALNRPGAPAAPPIPSAHSGRLELANWLTHPDHPLTARVIVNRLWQWHFGEGLVRSPDNFGITGERPTHPELLDWLAREFIRTRWSIKQFHRLILRSSTYQMSSAFDSRAAQADPDNRLLWRRNRQRLEAEPLRDALLAVSGQLDPALGGSLVSWPNGEYTPDDTVSATSRRRAVYLPVVRDRVYDVFTIFDFANPSVGVGRRGTTVVAHQALFFLNSPFVREQSRHLAQDLRHRPGDDRARLHEVYRRVLGRAPTRRDIERAMRFLEAQRAQPQSSRDQAGQSGPGETNSDLAAWTSLTQALFASNEFLYIN